MKRSRVLSVALVAVAAVIAPAADGAQSLRDLRAQDADARSLAREAAYTSEVCGRPISAGIDWRSVNNWPADESLVDACDGALGAVETICRAGRKNVVHQFVCAGDGAGPSLSDKTLRYGASPGGNGYAATLATIGAAD